MKDTVRLLSDTGFFRSFANIEKDVLLQAVELNHYNLTNTAKALKISRSKLYRKLEEYGYQRPHHLFEDL